MPYDYESTPALLYFTSYLLKHNRAEQIYKPGPEQEIQSWHLRAESHLLFNMKSFKIGNRV